MDSWLQLCDDDPARHRIRTNCCRDRHCLPCSQERSRLIARNLADHLPASGLRFITLTLRSTAEPLGSELSRLYKAFASLRRAKVWTDAVDGGVAFLEITFNNKTGLWHPHLHLIVTGRYLPQSALSEAWHHRTRDSHVVDIRAVRSHGQVTSYVTKYVSKTAVPMQHLSDDRLDEWCHATERRHLCLTWGTFRGMHLLDREPSEDSWTTLCSLDSAIHDALAGNDYLREVLAALCPVRFALYFQEPIPCPDSS